MPSLVSNEPLSARIGKFWFKNRSLSPLPLFALMLILPANFSPSADVYALVVMGVLLAEGIRLWAVGYAGSATRTRGETVPELVHAGPYRWVRNPLYIANILLYTSISVAFGFTYFSVFVFLYSCVQYSFIVRFEEEILLRTFSQSYLYYLQETPRWFVGTRPLFPSSHHTFSLSRALRSERSTLLLIALVGVVWGIKFALKTQ